MSCAVEEWKEGPFSRVLQNIHELESQVVTFKKVCHIKQLQLRSLGAALQNRGRRLKKQSSMDLCDSLKVAKQKTSHDLRVKESQVSIQYKCELVRNEQIFGARDSSFSGTPQESFTRFLTPVHNDVKFEQLEEKYKKVQERRKLEPELRTLQAKEINQPHPQSTLNPREIAWCQAPSAVFSWQQEKTLSRNQDRPARSSVTSSFPWKKQTNSSVVSENKFDNNFAENCNSSFMMHLRPQNQELRSTVKDLEQQLQAQEKMKKSYMNKEQEAELQLDRMKLELTEKDKDLNKTKDTLTQMRTQLDQATTQVQVMKQMGKRLSEELNCQRQNAKNVRQSLEQKIKAKEKEYQQELSCQQRFLQKLDQQCNQISNDLNQELQQANSNFNILKAEFYKVMAVKQCLEYDTNDLTQKLCRAELALLAAQAKETDLARSFEKVKWEKHLLNCQLEKKLQEIHQLEEELNTIKQSLKQSQNFAEQMKNKNTFQEAELKLLEEKYKRQKISLSLEKLKIVLADMEKQRAQELLKEKENHIKEQNCKISKMEEELEALQNVLGFKEKKWEELQKEFTAFSQWKKEKYHLIHKLKSENEGMLTHISNLENSLQSQQIKNQEYHEKLIMMEIESDRKTTEIRELKNKLEYISAELDEPRKAFNELPWKAECSDKKYCKEIDNMSCKISQFTNQVGELEENLQLVASEELQWEQSYHDLQGKYEKISYLVKAKDTSEMTENGEVNLWSGQDKTVLDNTQLAANNSTGEDHRCARPLTGVRKTEYLSTLQDRLSSLEVFLVAQKQLSSNHQQQIEELLQIKGETEQRLFNVEEIHESFVAETKQCISNLQANISAQWKFIEKTSAVLEEKDVQLQALNKRLENQQAELQYLKINNKLLEDSVTQLKLMSGTQDSEKKDKSSIICSYTKNTEDITKENAALRDLSRALEQEQITLLEANKNISNSLKEREEIISDMSRKLKEERQCIELRTEEINIELQVLQAKNKLVEEENANMSIQRKETIEFEEKDAKLEREKQIQLHLTMSEKYEQSKSLEMDEKEQQEKESEMKKEISEYKDRLLQAEKHHLHALTEANQKMQQEKEMLQKQLGELLTKKEHKKEGLDESAITEETKLKLEEPQECTELKTREADEHLEKYHPLLVKYYKLEEENEILKSQIDWLSAGLKQSTSDAVSASLQNLSKPLTVTNESVKEMCSDEDTTGSSSERQRCEDIRKNNGEPRFPVPETSPKDKRKADVCQNLLDQEDTYYELDGLPEVVKKGFADIPTGKGSPYILRRISLNLRTSPHPASPSEKLPLPTQDVQKCRPNNLDEHSCSTPGGSKLQKADNINTGVQQKEIEFACRKVLLWWKSYNRVEQEKEMLPKQLAEYDELLKKKNLTMSK